MSGTPKAPFELTLADGSIVKAENIEEAFQTVAKMKTDTASALKQEREKREALEAQVAGLQSQVYAATAPKPVDGQFDKNEYYKLLNEDPLAAQNYLDAYRFGISSPEQVPQHFQQIDEAVNRIRQESVAAGFLQMHSEDFPAGPEAAAALTKRVEQLYQSGYPLEVSTLDFAYNQLVSEQVIKPTEKEPEKEVEPPNPSLVGSGAAISNSELTKVEQMDDKALEAFLRQKGVLK